MLKTRGLRGGSRRRTVVRVSPRPRNKLRNRGELDRNAARSSLRQATELQMPNILRILVVEPNRESRTSLHVRGSRYGIVESFANFESARARVMAGGFDYLVTNIQLEAFNGLHLV